MPEDTRFVLYPPRIGCDEVQRLKNRFKERGHHCFIAKRDGEYTPRASDLIIGWGYSRHPMWEQKALDKGSKWLNHCSKILNAVQKMESFELMEQAGVSIPKWTRSKQRAQIWSNAGVVIFARSEDRGCKGAGITVVQPGQEMPNALFYTQYIPNTKEYRVYVCRGTVIDVLEKRRISDATETNEYIRGSEESGWAFCRQNVHLSVAAKEQCIEAVKALGLDFGGVDLLTTGSQSTVLEVNTAPDIFGSGLDRFVDAFNNIAKAA